MFRREMGRYKRGLVGSFPGLGIMTVVACFQAGGKWWARMQLLKITVRATMAIRGRFLNMRGFKFVGPRGLFALQLPDVRFHLVRKNLDDERVVFREEAEGMIGGLRRKLLTLLITCAKKASSKWGSLGTWWICSRVSAKQFAFSRGVFMIALFRTRWWFSVLSEFGIESRISSRSGSRGVDKSRSTAPHGNGSGLF
jgi:hypothetical protein